MKPNQQKQIISGHLLQQKQAVIFRSTSQSIFQQSKLKVQSNIFYRISSRCQTKKSVASMAFKLESAHLYRHRIAYFALLYSLFQKQHQNAQLLLRRIKSLVYDENLIIKNYSNSQQGASRESVVNNSLVKKKKVGEFLNFMSKYKRQISFIKEINEITELDDILINLIVSLNKRPLNEDPIQRFLSLVGLNVAFKDLNTFFVNQVEFRILSNQIFQVVQKSSLETSASTNAKTPSQNNMIEQLQLSKLNDKVANKFKFQTLQQSPNKSQKQFKPQLKNSIIDDLIPFIDQETNNFINPDQDEQNLHFLEKSKRKNIQYIQTERFFVQPQIQSQNQRQHNKAYIIQQQMTQVPQSVSFTPLKSPKNTQSIRFPQNYQNLQNPEQLKRRSSHVFTLPIHSVKNLIISNQSQKNLFKAFNKEKAPNLHNTVELKKLPIKKVQGPQTRQSEHPQWNYSKLNHLISPRYNTNSQKESLISQKSQLVIHKNNLSNQIPCNRYSIQVCSPQYQKRPTDFNFFNIQKSLNSNQFNLKKMSAPSSNAFNSHSKIVMYPQRITQQVRY